LFSVVLKTTRPLNHSFSTNASLPFFMHNEQSIVLQEEEEEEEEEEAPLFSKEQPGYNEQPAEFKHKMRTAFIKKRANAKGNNVFQPNLIS
jgi:hypothetical protein